MNNDILNVDVKKEIRKRYSMIVIYILTLLFFSTSTVFTFSTINSLQKNTTDRVKVGSAVIDMTENKDTSIKLLNALPMSDEKGMKLNPFKFSVSNTGTLPLLYKLKLIDTSNQVEIAITDNEKLAYDKLKVSLIDKTNDKEIILDTLNNLNDYELFSSKILPTDKVDYELRLWLDEDAGNESKNKVFVGHIELLVTDVLDDGENNE